MLAHIMKRARTARCARARHDDAFRRGIRGTLYVTIYVAARGSEDSVAAPVRDEAQAGAVEAERVRCYGNGARREAMMAKILRDAAI